VALVGASVLSLAVFQTETLAGVGAAVIAGYRLGDSGSRVLAVVVGMPFLVLALAGLAGSGSSGAQTFAILLSSLVPAAAVAGSVRLATQETRERTATRQAIEGSLLEHTARGERARISRELHDVVAHHVSMIAVQAETARLAVPGMPADGTRHLLGIGDTARAALTEMRRLLGVLREDTEAGTADRMPQPGLHQLNDLLDEAREVTGGGVRLIVRGPADRLSPGVQLAVYRIVQESLTNARRHAPGASVDVELHYTRDALQLRIRDNGPGPDGLAPPGGHGLLGMRERIAAVGGELRIGVAAGGGFLIEASLPTAPEGEG